MNATILSIGIGVFIAALLGSAVLFLVCTLAKCREAIFKRAIDESIMWVIASLGMFGICLMLVGAML